MWMSPYGPLPLTSLVTLPWLAPALFWQASLNFWLSQLNGPAFPADTAGAPAAKR